MTFPNYGLNSNLEPSYGATSDKASTNSDKTGLSNSSVDKLSSAHVPSSNPEASGSKAKNTAFANEDSGVAIANLKPVISVPERLPNHEGTFAEDDVLNDTFDSDFFSSLRPNSRFSKIKKRSSVILARTGLKVHRSDSFFDNEFESLNEFEEISHHSNSGSFTSLNKAIKNADWVTSEDPERTSLLPNNQPPTSATERLKLAGASAVDQLNLLYHNQITRNVLKCSLAYFIASLGVYWTPFNTLLGNTDSKHVVATVAVYFHPARSKGSMHQSLIFVSISLIFSFLISFGCRSISSFFFNKGEDEVSYTIDLLISSIGLGMIAYMKQKVNKATFNTACSLASISVVTCIVKEGSLNSATIPFKRLVSTAQVVVIGSLISVTICYVLWPISAIDQLRKSLNDSYNIMSLGLSLIAERFLNGKKLSKQDIEMLGALKKNVGQLRSNLEEAKFELYVLGREDEFEVFEDLVNTTISLSRHIQALRWSAEMQWHLLHEDFNKSPTLSYTNQSFEHFINNSRMIQSNPNSINSSIHCALSESVENMDNIKISREDEIGKVNYNVVNSSQLFDLFVYYLAPSVKSFLFTIKGVLSEVPFEKSFESNENPSDLSFEPSQSKFIKSSNFQKSLALAIDLFETKQSQSFEKLYSQDIFKSVDLYLKADQEEVTACCGNFSSLLVLFGKGLIDFLKVADTHESIKSKPRTWRWLKFWLKDGNEEEESQQENTRVDTSLNEALINLQSQYKSSKIRKEQKSAAKKVDQYSYEIWKLLKVFRRTDVQFGIRVGLGAFCISIFAFYPRTQLTFNNWRGEWTLVIYCIMMNKSLGGTTMTVKWRFIGTFLGASTAWLIWFLSDGNVYALSMTGFLLSLPCFYIIIYWKMNNAFGRFILLTYNLTALYSYSMLQKDSEDDNEGGDAPIVWEIAFHRFIAVSFGIMWALTMASFFLPNSARARLKNALIVLWLRMGVIWNSDPLEYANVTTKEGKNEPQLVGIRDEKGINDLLAECETLIKQAPLEFRLKGRFPKDTYSQLINKSSSIIDGFQNMSLMVEVDPRLTANEKYVLDYIASEKSELEHRIFLIFYTIASAMKLGFPLPAKPASTEHAKDRLLFKLNEIRSNSAGNLDSNLTNEDYVLLYTYILVTSTITRELDEIINLVKDLLGDVDEDIFQLV